MEIRHYPVMHKEVLEYLLIPPGKSCMIDCTTGEGGHTSLFLSNYPDLEVIGLDRDRDIQAKAIERLAPFGSRFHPVLSWFDDYLAQADADSADAVLFDLGISMFHYAESGRGFSFRNGERLDMRLDADGALSAADVVNGYGEEALADDGEGFFATALLRPFAVAGVECVGDLDIGGGALSGRGHDDIPALAVRPHDVRHLSDGGAVCHGCSAELTYFHIVLT